MLCMGAAAMQFAHTNKERAERQQQHNHKETTVQKDSKGKGNHSNQSNSISKKRPRESLQEVLDEAVQGGGSTKRSSTSHGSSSSSNSNGKQKTATCSQTQSAECLHCKRDFCHVDPQQRNAALARHMTHCSLAPKTLPVPCREARLPKTGEEGRTHAQKADDKMQHVSHASGGAAACPTIRDVSSDRARSAFTSTGA